MSLARFYVFACVPTNDIGAVLYLIDRAYNHRIQHTYNGIKQRPAADREAARLNAWDKESE